jgi:hypothetical protein
MASFAVENPDLMGDWRRGDRIRVVWKEVIGEHGECVGFAHYSSILISSSQIHRSKELEAQPPE